MFDNPAADVARIEVLSIGANVSNSLVLVVLETFTFGTCLRQQFSDLLLTATRCIFAAVFLLLHSAHVCITLFEHGEQY